MWHVLPAPGTCAAVMLSTYLHLNSLSPPLSPSTQSLIHLSTHPPRRCIIAIYQMTDAIMHCVPQYPALQSPQQLQSGGTGGRTESKVAGCISYCILVPRLLWLHSVSIVTPDCYDRPWVVPSSGQGLKEFGLSRLICFPTILIFTKRRPTNLPNVLRILSLEVVFIVCVYGRLNGEVNCWLCSTSVGVSSLNRTV